MLGFLEPFTPHVALTKRDAAARGKGRGGGAIFPALTSQPQHCASDDTFHGAAALFVFCSAAGFCASRRVSGQTFGSGVSLPNHSPAHFLVALSQV